MSRRIADVLIVGAGPAGCATALALAGSGRRVVVLERPTTQPLRSGESAAPDVGTLLRRLGVGGRLERCGHGAYQGNISLWGDDVPYLEHFLSRGAGHGWHLDRAAFDEQLRSEVRSRDIQLHRCAGIESITLSRDGWHVQADGPGAIFAHVIVDAGGRRSPLAARLGVTRRKLDKLIALATYASGPGRLTGLSLVEAFEHGWWYAAPVPDGRVLVTLMTDQDIAVTHGFHRWDSYVRAWSESRLLSSYLMPSAEPAVIHRFAAHSGCLERAAGKGWIAVGDALMGWDPLTSSGISGALSDGLAAAPAIAGMLEDRWDAARTYAERANAVFGRYLTERMQRYGAESRWRRNVFWMRRTTQPQWGAAQGRAGMGAPD